jgi:hypothetical protein
MSKHRWTRSRVAAILAAVTATMAFAGPAGAAPDEENLFLPAASIGVDAPNQLVGGVAKLHAYANFINIPNSPYYLKIYDVTTNTFLTQRGDVNDVVAYVTQNVATTHTYRAYIAEYNKSFPPSGVQGFTDQVSVTWDSKLVLNTSATGLFNGEKATLTAKAAGPGAMRIKDLTTGQTVAACSSPATTVCTATVTGFSSSHTYAAAQSGQASSSNSVSVSWQKIPG